MFSWIACKLDFHKWILEKRQRAPAIGKEQYRCTRCGKVRLTGYAASGYK